MFNAAKQLTKEDEDGVPRVVQRLRYRFLPMLFEAKLCSGARFTLPAEVVTPDLKMLHHPTADHFADAYKAMTEFATTHWTEIHQGENHERE